MIIYKNDPPESCWFAPERNKLLATVDMPANYEFSFEVRPTATVGDWASLVHVTAFDDNASGSYGRRIPGFWFHPNSTNLHAVPARVGAGNPHVSIGDLPLNEITRIRLIAFGTTVRLYVNDETKARWNDHQRQAHPGAKLYAGDPWYIAANAMIRHVEIRESAAFLAPPKILTSEQIKPLISAWDFSAELNAAYGRTEPVCLRPNRQGVSYDGSVTVGLDWDNNPSQSVIVRIDLTNGKLLAHKRGSTRYYEVVNALDGLRYEFTGQAGKDVVDLATFGA